MKICPFISHMIGEDRTAVLEVNSGETPRAQDDPGVQPGKGGGVGVKTRAEAKASAPTTSHLFCMRETCRFYRKADGECSFDVMFEAAESQAKASSKATASEKVVTRELEKFWKFQTKSVAELISSVGDNEQKQEKALTRLQEDLGARLDKLSNESVLDSINGQLGKLQEATQSREEGMEELSSTVSRMVMSFEDNLRELKVQSTQLSERMARLESAMPGAEQVRTWIGESLESTGTKDDFIKERFELFVEAHTKFEADLREWRKTLDQRVDGWAGQLETIASKAPVAEAAPRPEEPSANVRKKARNLNNLGVTSFHNGELELARDQFRQAVGFDPNFAECYNNLGLVLTELDQDDEATEAFSRALKINPDLHSAYNNLGYVFYKQGSYDQAIEMYNEALGRSSNNTSAYTNLGNAYFKQDKFDDARRAWEKALELDPSNRRAARNLKDLERSGE